MTHLSIGEVARRTGLSSHTLRYYEKVELLPAPARRHGRRSYDPSVLHRVRFLKLAREAGFGIEALRGLVRTLDGDRVTPESRASALTRLAELDEAIRQLQRARAQLAELIECPCEGLATCAHLE